METQREKAVHFKQRLFILLCTCVLSSPGRPYEPCVLGATASLPNSVLLNGFAASSQCHEYQVPARCWQALLCSLCSLRRQLTVQTRVMPLHLGVGTRAGAIASPWRMWT